MQDERDAGAASNLQHGFAAQAEAGDREVLEADDEDGDRKAESAELWTGLLEFLNDPGCYLETTKLPRAVASFDLDDVHALHRFSARSFLRRWRTACLKRRTDFRELDRSEPFADLRNQVGRVALSPITQGTVMCVIVVDLLSMVWFNETQRIASSVIDALVIAFLTCEVCARIVYLGKMFTHSILNCLEFVLAAVLVLEVTAWGISPEEKGATPLVRAFRPIIRGLNFAGKAIYGVRHAVTLRHMLQLKVASSNRRYTQDGHDLDLCYITDQVIAMGRPAVRKDALYNNPLTAVARLLNTRHPKRYIVVNCTMSYTYPIDPLHGRVLRFPVRNHGVPLLAELWELCAAMQDFLGRHPRNVVAVHAYADGGRVGTVIAGWLIFSGALRQPTSAMAHYERSRTAVGATDTVQGFDSASQRRFLEAFAACVHDFKGVPQARVARLNKIRLFGLKMEDGGRLAVRVFAQNERKLTGSGCSARTVVPKSGSTRLNEEDDEDDEGVLLMMHEEKVIEEAKQEQKAQAFDSVDKGCHPLRGEPIFDTVENTRFTSTGTCKHFVTEDDDTCETAVWEFEGVSLEGQICLEVYHVRVGESGFELTRQQTDECWVETTLRSRSLPRSHLEDGGDGGDDAECDSTMGFDCNLRGVPSAKPQAARQMLFAMWFHTSLLEMSQNMRTHAGVDDKTVGIVLKRFDLDKAAGAPSLLKSCGASFEFQISFEVDDALEFKPLPPGRCVIGGGVAKAKPRLATSSADEFLRLHPPSGVEVSNFCDLGWLSWCVDKLWPFVEAALVKKIKLQVEPQLQESAPKMFNNLRFSTFTLGRQKPILGPLIASQRIGEQMGIQLDIAIEYNGDANIVLDVGIAKVGVDHILLKGTLSVLLDPIVNKLPVIGGIKFFFLNPPAMDLRYVGFKEVLNFSFLKSFVQRAIDNALAEALVMPNVIAISWMPERFATGEPFVYLSTTPPMGVLRLTIIEAHGFIHEHCCYCVVKFGAASHRTELSKKVSGHTKSVVPQWGETRDMPLHDMKQLLCIEIWVHDHTAGHKLVGVTPLQEVKDVLVNRGSQWLEFGPAGGAANDDGEHDEFRHAHGFCADKGGNRGSAKILADKGYIRFEAALFELEADPEQLDRSVVGSSNLESNGRGGSTNPAMNMPVLPAELASALLVCNVERGRLPSDCVAGASLSISVAGSEEMQHKCVPCDETWRAQVELDPSLVSSIDVLLKEGFTAKTIAKVLNAEEAVVNKVMAQCLAFNVEVPRHFCVFVRASALAAGDVDFEVRRRGRTEATGKLSLQAVVAAPSMKLRRVVTLFPRRESEPKRLMRQVNMKDAAASKATSAQQRFDFDIEFKLFAYGSASSAAAAGECFDTKESSNDPTVTRPQFL